MAPKRKASELDKGLPPRTEEAEAELVESKRLQEAAYARGLVSKTRRISTQSAGASALPARVDGLDITKKSSVRKGRQATLGLYACSWLASGIEQIKMAGMQGTLANLDTQNPVLYIDFPTGRLKCFGTLIFPKNKYMLLRLGQKDVMCEEVLESMIVFAEHWWIGTKEANPEERRLPLPLDLQQAAEEEPPIGAADLGEAAHAVSASQRERDIDVDPIDDGDESEEEPVPAPRRPARQRAQKQPKYAELPSDSDEEDDDDGDAGSSAEEDSQGRVSAPKRLTSQQGAGGARKGAANGHAWKAFARRGVPRDDLSNEDKEAPSKPNAGPKKATKLLNKDTDEVEDEVSRKLTNGRRKSVRVTEDDDEEEEEVIHLDDTPVKSQRAPPPARKRATPAKRSAAKKAPVVEADSSEDSEDDPGSDYIDDD